MYTKPPLLETTTPLVHSISSILHGPLIPAISITNSSLANPTANLALYIPFSLDRLVTAYAFMTTAVTATGNIDFGIYNLSGDRIVSTGSVTNVAATTRYDITDTVLSPGTYYMAFSCSNNTDTFYRDNSHPYPLLAAAGVKQQTSAFPLPETATFSDAQGAFTPVFFVLIHPLVD